MSVPMRVESLADLPSLTHLRLRAIGLEEAEGGLLAHNGLLEVLDLSHNRLPALPLGWLDGCRLLSDLDLSHNLIAALGHPPNAAEGNSSAAAAPLNCEPSSGCTVCDACCEVYIPNGDACESCAAQHCGGGGRRRTQAEEAEDGEGVSSASSIDDSPLRWLAQLQTLDLAGNSLTTLPPALLHGNGRLRSLDLSGNNIAQLPADGMLSSQPQLQQLDLSSNALQSVPPQLLHATPQLQQLDLSYVPFKCSDGP